VARDEGLQPLPATGVRGASRERQPVIDQERGIFEMPDMIRVTPTIEIDEDELVEAFVRASGPGGQNVNKVASAVELRFNVDHSENLTAPVKTRLRRLAGRRLNQEGWIVLKADRYRSQERNRDDARQRLVAMIAEAAVPPRPRIKTRPSLAAKKRRLEAKSRRGNVKKLRSRKSTFD
jgi:ribosome-associated protein